MCCVTGTPLPSMPRELQELVAMSSLWEVYLKEHHQR